MTEMIAGWVERGVDGFRVDAIDRPIKDVELRDDPPSPSRSRCRSTPTSSTST